MIEIKEGLLLYHGSYCKVEKPSLEKCASGKDFGRGFYLTSSKEQAIKFLNTSLAKAKVAGEIDTSQDYGYVNTFRIKTLDGINKHTFEEANVEWLHCVAAHRKKGIFLDVIEAMKDYNLVIGKIADDATNATLTAYLAGAFGEVGSSGADNLCIRQLLPNKLQDQFCYRTDEALSSIEFIGGEQIWLNK